MLRLITGYRPAARPRQVVADQAAVDDDIGAAFSAGCGVLAQTSPRGLQEAIHDNEAQQFPPRRNRIPNKSFKGGRRRRPPSVLDAVAVCASRLPVAPALIAPVASAATYLFWTAQKSGRRTRS